MNKRLQIYKDHKSIISFDLDGVICKHPGSIKLPSDEFSKIHKHAAKIINNLYASGHYIIIHTARISGKKNWQGKHAKDIKKKLKEFLVENGVFFHEIWDSVGKPPADLYVDDRAYRFIGWQELKNYVNMFHKRS